MRRTVLAVLAFLILIPVAVQAQDVELATYTPEQRWERAGSQMAVMGIAAIAYAKSVGQSADSFAENISDLFASGWGEPGSGSLRIIRGLHRNYSLFPDCEFEIVEQSEESVTGRVNRPWVKYFGDDEVSYGVTLAEYERTFKIFNSRLSEYLGLNYEEWTEDGWIYFTFSLGG